MNKAFLIAKKDIKLSFSSPLVFVLAALFIGLLGYLFFNVFIIADQIKDLPLNAAVMRPLFGNMNTLFIFIIPLFSMNLISEEKRQNTINLLFMSPAKDWEIYLGKLISGMVLILFYLSLTMIFPIILFVSGYENWQSSLTGYIGLFVNATSYLVFSFFFSSLTKNTIFAAMSSIFGLLLIIGLAWTSQTTENIAVSELFSYLSLSTHFEPFSRGVIKSVDMIYYLSFIFFFSLLTLKSFESRDW